MTERSAKAPGRTGMSDTLRGGEDGGMEEEGGEQQRKEGGGGSGGGRVRKMKGYKF